MKRFYTLFNGYGQIPSETFIDIQSQLNNKLAVKNLPNCLKECFKKLEQSHVHVMIYANVEIWAIKATSTTARNAQFDVKFENQNIHDADGMTKIMLTHKH